MKILHIRFVIANVHPQELLASFTLYETLNFIRKPHFDKKMSTPTETTNCPLNCVSLQSVMRSIDRKKPAADWEESLHSLFARCSDPKIPELVPEERYSSFVMSVMECLSRNCGALLETKTSLLLLAAAFVHRGIEAHFTTLLVSDLSI